MKLHRWIGTGLKILGVAGLMASFEEVANSQAPISRPAPVAPSQDPGVGDGYRPANVLVPEPSAGGQRSQFPIFFMDQQKQLEMMQLLSQPVDPNLPETQNSDPKRPVDSKTRTKTEYIISSSDQKSSYYTQVPSKTGSTVSYYLMPIQQPDWSTTPPVSNWVPQGNGYYVPQPTYSTVSVCPHYVVHRATSRHCGRCSTSVTYAVPAPTVVYNAAPQQQYEWVKVVQPVTEVPAPTPHAYKVDSLTIGVNYHLERIGTHSDVFDGSIADAPSLEIGLNGGAIGPLKLEVEVCMDLPGVADPCRLTTITVEAKDGKYTIDKTLFNEIAERFVGQYNKLRSFTLKDLIPETTLTLRVKALDPNLVGPTDQLDHVITIKPQLWNGRNKP